MELDKYQTDAKSTDQFSEEKEKIFHSLLNLTESVSVLHRLIEQPFRKEEKSLPAEYMKEQLVNKIGDILWYLSNVASRKEILLSTAAERNLEKNQLRWGNAQKFKGKQFDENLPVYERLPRSFRMAFFDPENSGKKIAIAIPTDSSEWIQVGDRIDDNANDQDGYRYHDVLHLANAAYLGWSPVIRALLHRKRKSQPDTDRIEDGARSVNLEEALTAFIFAHASKVNYFENAEEVDFNLLKTIERLTRNLEVKYR